MCVTKSARKMGNTMKQQLKFSTCPNPLAAIRWGDALYVTPKTVISGILALIFSQRTAKRMTLIRKYPKRKTVCPNNEV